MEFPYEGPPGSGSGLRTHARNLGGGGMWWSEAVVPLGAWPVEECLDMTRAASNIETKLGSILHHGHVSAGDAGWGHPAAPYTIVAATEACCVATVRHLCTLKLMGYPHTSTSQRRANDTLLIIIG